MALATNTKLKDLNLAINHIADKGGIQLARNTHLTTLNVALNDLGDEAARAFGRNISLTSLDLQSNKITKAGVDALVDNPRLKVLRIWGNPLEKHFVHTIEKRIADRNVAQPLLFTQGPGTPVGSPAKKQKLSASAKPFVSSLCFKS